MSAPLRRGLRGPRVGAVRGRAHSLELDAEEMDGAGLRYNQQSASFQMLIDELVSMPIADRARSASPQLPPLPCPPAPLRPGLVVLYTTLIRANCDPGLTGRDAPQKLCANQVPRFRNSVPAPAAGWACVTGHRSRPREPLSLPAEPYLLQTHVSLRRGARPLDVLRICSGRTGSEHFAAMSGVLL